jgi:hypothetical protein
MTSPLFAMPADWDDAAGWETFHAGLYPAGPFRDARSWLEQTLTMIGRNLVALMGQLRQRSGKSVWFPGCGLDPLPRLFAELGFDAHATDVAPTAVTFQQSADNDVSALKQHYRTLGAPDAAPGSFTVALHDFREPCPAGPFDLILNFKSFQAFPEGSLRKIARVHHDALKPGCVAYFDTMNVQGERRDLLESTLAEAGFTVPGYQARARLGKALRETGIPYIFILGRPMVPRHGEYAHDEERAQRDTARLQAIFAEHVAQAQAESQEEASRIGPDARTAVVIYNTG